MLKKIFIKCIGFFVNRLMQISSEEIEDGRTTSEKNKAVCRQAVAEGCVLLKNNGVFPLKKEKISLFGRVAYNTFYTGYGSGGDVKATYKVSIRDGLASNGISLVEEADAAVSAWAKKHPPYDGFWGFWPLSYPEMPLSESLLKECSQKSETAIFVLGRSSGEDRDNKYKKGAWFLSNEEEKTLKRIRKHFKKVAVLINAGGIMDMRWIERLKIDAVMYVFQGGQETGNGIADLLNGNVSPSGRLTDTIADYNDYASSQNFGSSRKTIYAEDIFVGYRYFSTFAKEKVIYPFGYGLSYTSFSVQKERFDFDSLTVTVNVTNTGNYPGKEVVQLYAKLPKGKIGKSERVLIAFAKTKTLNPSESEKITLSFDKSSLACFDDKGSIAKNSFVLEKGTYRFILGENANVGQEIASVHLDEEVLQTCSCISPTKTRFKRLVGGDGERYEEVPLEKINLKERILAGLPSDFEKKGEYTFADLISKKVTVEEFAASLPDEQLEQLLRGSNEGMYDPNGVAGNSGIIGGTNDYLRKKGIPVLSTHDGPSGVRLQAHSTLVPIATMLASTFNTKLVFEIGSVIGEEMRERGSHIQLAPNVNIHRNPLCGRNFEYMSEDPYVSGKMGAAYVSGVQSHGVSATVKHFACNNQERARHLNSSEVSQRALREIYFKPFEICIKESNPDYVMSSYNKLNGIYGCYNYDLATTLLRGEWKYDGCVMTDWWMDKASSPDFKNVSLQAYRIRAQVDLFMPGSAKFGKYKNKSDLTLLKALKKGGITRGEVLRSASNVLRRILKSEERNREEK